ncbi:hypothetical protein EDD18DRAFT_1357401 [Armillaria luteobubalina]|uniref:Uncharacterized protein n=1 Tax=Armillaria luteobubalina TaxID=153913 RepID=A0AA39UU62_9AGAR|nr:hypothetical protein EDD18DRAFT_1357401 [Armillaria luteobubalina]
MALRFYYIRVGLQARDTFFGNTKQIYTRSPSLVGDFPAKVLLEAERRYAGVLSREGVDKLSIFSGWHTSLLNPRYHYTLRGYNTAGWMAVTVEMEASNQGMYFTYDSSDWNRWMLHEIILRSFLHHYSETGLFLDHARVADSATLPNVMKPSAALLSTAYLWGIHLSDSGEILA